MRRTVLQDLADDRSVREAENVVKVLPGVLRIAARMRATQDGDGAPGSKQVAESVSEQGCFAEGTDEDEIDVFRQFVHEVLEPGVADERDLVAFGLAPRGDYLRHDAGEIRVHGSRPQRSRRTLGHQVDDADAQAPLRSSAEADGILLCGARHNLPL